MRSAQVRLEEVPRFNTDRGADPPSNGIDPADQVLNRPGLDPDGIRPKFACRDYEHPAMPRAKIHQRFAGL